MLAVLPQGKITSYYTMQTLKNAIFTFENLYYSALKCACGVKWKNSVAHFILNLDIEIEILREEIASGNYKEKPHKTFKVFEPKERDVLSLAFRDRVVQRTFCDLIVYPIMTRSFILDNCACQKGKGTDFARDRLLKHMRRYYQRNGSNDGYLIHIDVKKYYPSIPHDKAEELLQKKLPKEAFALAKEILSMYQGEKGYNPGSQIIQIIGVAMLDKIDHYIKEKLFVKEYVRYMDDLILLVRGNPQAYIDEIEQQLANMGFELNTAKTKFVKLYKGDIFLGFSFSLSNSGKVYKAISNKNIKRRIEKIKKTKYKNVEELDASYSTWKSYAEQGCNKKTILKAEKVYNDRRQQYGIFSTT